MNSSLLSIITNCLKVASFCCTIIKNISILPPKINAKKAALCSLSLPLAGDSGHPLVVKARLTVAKSTIMTEGEIILFSESWPDAQFARTWLTIKDVDLKKLINQNVSFNASCLYPCCVKDVQELQVLNINQIEKIREKDKVDELLYFYCTT